MPIRDCPVGPLVELLQTPPAEQRQPPAQIETFDPTSHSANPQYSQPPRQKRAKLLVQTGAVPVQVQSHKLLSSRQQSTSISQVQQGGFAGHRIFDWK